MVLTTTTLAIFAIVAATGLIWAIAVSQPADAWHTIWGSKKLCVQDMKTINGNTTAQAQFICQKLVSH